MRFVPFELGRPVWVDDPHFTLAYHVRHTALPPPGRDGELCALMGRLMSQPLDRDRPLWESWVVEGLEGGRWALVSKVHHCMVDGIAGVELLSVLLDAERDVALPPPAPWRPSPEPSAGAMVLDAWRGLGADVVADLRGAPAALRAPRRALRRLANAGIGTARFLRNLTAEPSLGIEGRIGPNRVYAHAEASIADVKQVRRAFGGTVNDVVLAAVTRGYRTLLEHMGDDPRTATLRTLIPVSLRDADGHGVPDNRVSALLLELPVDIAHPVERLHEIRVRMAALKESHMAEAGRVVNEVGPLLPPMVVGTATRLILRAIHRLPQHSINTVATNVPGPQFPLYCLGREMLAYYPYVPISHGVRVGTAILSYHGTLSFGVTGDFDATPKVHLLAGAIAEGITELRDLAQRSAGASA